MSNLEEATAMVLHNFKDEDDEGLSELPVYTIINVNERGMVEEEEDTEKIDESNEKPIYRPFSCPACSKSFTRRGDMLRHHRKHTGERPFQCSHCGDEFTRKDDMTRHMKTHQGIKPHNCPVCQKSFGRKADMVKHLLVHAGVKTCGCPTCGCPFSHSKTGKKGFNNFSNNPRENKHGCPECEESFKRKMDLNAHIKNQHPNFFKIDDPSKGNANIIHLLAKKDKFNSGTSVQLVNEEINNTVQSHVNLNNSVDGKLNNVSNNVFESIRALRESKSTRKSKKDKANAKIIGLPEIYTGTTGTKPFECPECSDRFGRKADMIRHLRIHSGVKPFNCGFCSKSFCRKEDMVRHSKTHTDSSKYNCKYCATGFTKRNEYAIHMLEHIDKA